MRVDSEGRSKSKIAPYAPRVGACAICPAKCCRLSVKVSVADALHFCQTLGVPFFSGLTVEASAHPQHAFRLDADPRWTAEPEAWPGRAELALRRRSDGGCHALVDVGGYERCGLYAARPSFCRTYPVTWKANDAEGGPPAVVCPVPYGITEAEEAQLTTEIERSIVAWEQHDDLVAEWNGGAGPFTIEAFIGFVVPRAAKVRGADLGCALSVGTADERHAQAVFDSGVVKAIPGTAWAAPKMFAGVPEISSEPRSPAKED